MEAFELAPYIQKLITATQAGTARWTQANPSTLFWQVESPTPAQVTIQVVTDLIPGENDRGIARFDRVKRYILEVIDNASSEQVLSANGSTDSGLNGLLAVLFDDATAAATKRALDFFDAIIPPTPQASSAK